MQIHVHLLYKTHNVSFYHKTIQSYEQGDDFGSLSGPNKKKMIAKSNKTAMLYKNSSNDLLYHLWFIKPNINLISPNVLHRLRDAKEP